MVGFAFFFKLLLFFTAHGLPPRPCAPAAAEENENGADEDDDTDAVESAPCALADA